MRILLVLILFVSCCKAQQPCFNTVVTPTGVIQVPCSIADLAYYHQRDSIYTIDSTATAIATAQRAAFVANLKSSAYKGLQGFIIGGTLTAAQLQEAVQVYLFNLGAFNEATGKVDSVQNYIH